MNETTSWRALTEERMRRAGDTGPVIACTMAEDEWVFMFERGYGGVDESFRFYAWTETHVYFADIYDGLASVGYAPRNPTSEFGP